MSDTNDHVATTPLLSSSTYDKIRSAAQRIVPAIGTFYAAIALLWHLPYSTEVVGTTAALTLLLGVVMSVSKKSYDNSDEKYDGEVLVATGEDGEETHSLSFNAPLTELTSKDSITLAVKPDTSDSDVVDETVDSQ